MKLFRFAMLLLTCSFALTLVFAGNAHATNGARVVKYSSTDVIPIRAKVRFSTLIVLPADEEILDFTTGDKEFWIINGAHNLCYLHPAQAGIRSNLNLVTASGHVYSFLLTEISKEKESGKETDAEADLKVFVTPDGEGGSETNASMGASKTITPAKYVRASEAEAYKNELAGLRNQLAEEQKHNEDEATKAIASYKQSYPAKLAFDYAIDKKARTAPFLVSGIYHDDAFTYIKSSASERPTLYEMKDGKPNLINFDDANGVYIVPKILDSGYLVVGKKRVTFHRESAAQANTTN
jgi:type IV secretion system protein VirB9